MVMHHVCLNRVSVSFRLCNDQFITRRAANTLCALHDQKILKSCERSLPTNGRQFSPVGWKVAGRALVLSTCPSPV